MHEVFGCHKDDEAHECGEVWKAMRKNIVSNVWEGRSARKEVLHELLSCLSCEGGGNVMRGEVGMVSGYSVGKGT